MLLFLGTCEVRTGLLLPQPPAPSPQLTALPCQRMYRASFVGLRALRLNLLQKLPRGARG